MWRQVPDRKVSSQTRVTPPDWHVAEAWLTSLKAKRQKMASAYGDAINAFLAFLRKPVADITVEDALEYVGHLSESGLSRATVALHIAAIRSFLRHCQELGVIAQTPLDGSKRSSVTANMMKRHITYSEVERLLAAVRDVLLRYPLGRPARISIVLGIALPILLWIVSDEKTALGLMVLIITMPLWIGAIRMLIHIGQWTLTGPEEQASNPH